MKDIIIASRNRGKIGEIRSMLAECGVTLRSLDEYPNLPEVSEDGNSFLDNALKKAKQVAELTGKTVLADDSGLEVDALGGAPGIHSARYAGGGADDETNVRKLLGELQGVPPGKRGAAFRCVLVLCRPDGRFHVFDGKWEGRIAEAPAGKGGFGYDPVFYLPGEGATAAELPAGIKNRISHRAKAAAKLRRWLRERTDENGA
ncbi:MAG: XTP/dITP diphosphatase [Thermodesulfobacteriota bacterium]